MVLSVCHASTFSIILGVSNLALHHNTADFQLANSRFTCSAATRKRIMAGQKYLKKANERSREQTYTKYKN